MFPLPGSVELGKDVVKLDLVNDHDGKVLSDKFDNPCNVSTAHAR
jgi:hypothetical protein